MVRTLQVVLESELFFSNHVHRFEEHHVLGEPAQATVEVMLEDYFDVADLVGTEARLQYGYLDDTPRVFAGIIESAAIVARGPVALTDALTRAFHYELRLVSRLALLERSFGCEIHQEINVKDIVSKVLKDGGVPDDKVEWKLTGSYPPYEYCVQYEESALAFVSRLLEREGIYCCSQHDPEKGEKLVFADDSTSAAPIDGTALLPLRARSRMHDGTDAVYAIRHQRSVVSGKFVLRDFNFEKPDLDLTANAEADARSDLEIYDYPGGYFDKSEGERLTKVRLHAEQSRRNTLTIEGECVHVSVGRKLTLSETENDDGDYFVSSVSHSFEAAVTSASKDQRGVDKYVMTASLVPIAVVYRCPLKTPAPVIAGPQTATVVCPDGSEAESIHTDKHGRCKVKFNWDRAEGQNDTSSCWMRVTQPQTSGSMMLPRVDWEVIVEFLEGNPDRPIVTGRLYNGVFTPPYALPEGKTRSAIMTSSTPGGGGSNEIRFEDKAGSEEIMIHSQKDTKTVTANNKTKNVGNNETSVVKVNSSLTVGSNQDVKVTKGYQNTIGASQTVSVGGNRSVEVNAVTGLTVSGSATTSVGGNQFEMDGNPLEALIDLAAQKAAEFAAAKAGEAIAKIQGAVQGKVDEVLAPINNLTSQAQALGDGMQAVANGDLSAAGSLVANASGLPGAGDFAASLGGGGGGDGAGGGGGGSNPISEAASGASALTSMARSAIGQGGQMANAAAGSAIQQGASAGASALKSALGINPSGGGGSSMANAAGPEGNVDGIDATDRAKGPGHSTAKVAGTHTEEVGGIKVMAALNGIYTNVTADMTQTVGAAHVELVIGSRSESVETTKDEKSIGLVVLTKGGESEQVTGSKTTMVGGAILDSIKANHAVEAKGPATFIGAFHKLEAKSKITLKCGASEIVIDGGGVKFSSAMISVLAGKIQLPKDVAED